MKHQFQFDKKTGTMVPKNDALAQGIKANVKESITERKTDDSSSKPVFTDEKRIEMSSNSINVAQNKVVQMKRMNVPTPIQLVDENGLPESYLDSITTGVMMFREREDYDICQIVDEKTGKILAYIGGYALQFNFNMAELKTLERIEQCLQGIVKLLRHKIMNQALDGKSPEE